MVNEERCTVTSIAKSNNIRRLLVQGEVVKTFIKTKVTCYFNPISFFIIIIEILGGIREETEEDSFARVGFEFSITFTWRTTSHATTKILEVLEVITSTKSSLKTRGLHIATGVGIEKSKCMIKTVRPKSRI